MAKIYDKVKFFDHVKILPSGISNPPPTPPPAPAIPLYALSRSVASANEGTSITFTLSTAHVANGTSVPYVINGISQEDLVAGSLNGNFVVNNSSSTLSFTIAEDTLTEGTETLTLSAANKTASVSILDTSREPIVVVDPGLDYKLSRSVASANEGSVVAYTLSSWFFGIGDVVPYTIGGISADDLIYGSLTGNFAFTNTETATLSFTIASDLLTEGSEVMTLSAIEKASSITIVDTSVTPEFPPAYKLIRSASSTTEGGNVVFTLSSVNVPQGTVVPYKINGISQDDLYAGYIEGSFTIDYDGTAAVGFAIANDLLTEGTETMTISAAGKTASISIVDTSLSPQYRIARSAASTNEGTTVTYTLSSDTAPDGTLVPYTVTGINAADLSSGSLTGNFEVYSQSASVSFTLANDFLMEGPETMTISAGGRTSSILINDTSLNPLYALSRSAASTNEGTTVTYTLSTARVGEGAQVPYKITGLSAEDLSSGLLEGAFVVDGAGFSTLSFTLANDRLTEGTETMTLSAGNRTSAITINDTSLNPAYALSRSAASANEGTTVTYTLSTTRVDEGSYIPYKITGLSAEDLSSGTLEGNFVIDGAGFSTLSFTLANDQTTEGTETMTLSAAGRTSAISILDTSKLPTYSLTRSAASANEGTTVIYTLATTSVLNGTEIPYAITGISQEDLSFGSVTGNFVINNNTASISATLASDLLTEGTETITIVATTPLGDYTQTTTIADTSRTLYKLTTPEPLFTLTPQQNTVTFTLSSTANLNGTSISYKLSGINAQDLTSGSLLGNFDFASNESSTSFTLNGSLTSTRTLLLSASVGTTSRVIVVPEASKRTILLLNGDTEGDGSTNIVDQTGINTILQIKNPNIKVGDVFVDNNVKKFGNGSLCFLKNNPSYNPAYSGTASGPALKNTNANTFDIPSNIFTVEFWMMRPDTSLTRRPIIHNNGNSDVGFAIGFETYGGNQIVVNLNGVGLTISSLSPVSIYSSYAPAPNEWHHVAVSGYPGSYKLFVNGQQTGITYTGYVSLGAGTLFVGGNDNGARSVGGANNQPFYLDDLRVIENVALYTSNFTPPTGPLTINI